MTELLVISPYFCMFYILYAIRNTLYATRYTRIEYPESSNDLCKTNPISEESKMSLIHYMTKEYENKSGLLTMVKQTQSNPTCSELVEPILSTSGGFKRHTCSGKWCAEHTLPSELFGEFANLNFPERIEIRKWIRKIIWKALITKPKASSRCE
jgi:hypothetical protein